jgi:hypothetical protein
MDRDTLRELKTEAKRLGVTWGDVLDEYAIVKSIELERRERPREIRKTAWHALVGSQSGSAPFWRHGFLARFGRQLARGADYTCVRGYDDIRQSVTQTFPEFLDPPGESGRGTEDLFEFLFSPYDPMPSREQMLREALARIEAAVDRPEVCYDDLPEY